MTTTQPYSRRCYFPSLLSKEKETKYKIRFELKNSVNLAMIIVLTGKDMLRVGLYCLFKFSRSRNALTLHHFSDNLYATNV